jgi:hypothetical protein
MDTTTAQPTAEETALRGRINALKAVAEMLHDDLAAYAKTQSPEATNANNESLTDVIDAHVVATGKFCDSALGCVPPTK